ncbi:MAG: undecaprenyl/decaprenyl-phosphate alpha-N-acetylglucosaminyl 1-phosphate transferase [Pirellulaceae bacterium]|nr:undecaprenyl/decaprenyl-phosphate alpha-N-acetylglucosaminyl 1-phosphate transferase [Pirellulaceae bacterium]
MLTLAKVFLVALLSSLLLTPVVRRWALRWGIVDHPDEHRKLHDGAMPLAGGLAVMGGFCLALAVALAWSPNWRDRFAGDWGFLAGLLSASAVIGIVGLLDDRYRLRGRQKLFGQIVAAAILIWSGLLIESIAIFAWRIELGLLAIPFTLFWLLGATNALNLIDGVDGLATSVGIVLSLAVSVMALMTGHLTEAMLAMAVAGSLAGFLVYNISPASIFLGDAGSMFIGLAVGALAIRCSLKGPATIALAAPTALLAVPILDVTMAILRRTLMGRSIYSADRGHLHHRLIHLGFGPRNTVLVIALLCAVTAVGALISEYAQNDVMAISAVAAVVSVLAVSRLFGHHEFMLLLRRTKHVVVSLLPLGSRGGTRRGESQDRLHGSGQWNELWETLVAFAERFDLSSVHLNVHLPALGEEYRASWNRKAVPADTDLWHSDIPLIVDSLAVGRLRITGRCGNGSVCVWMSDLIAGLKSFETQMLDLIAAEYATKNPDLGNTNDDDTSFGQPRGQRPARLTS